LRAFGRKSSRRKTRNLFILLQLQNILVIRNTEALGKEKKKGAKENKHPGGSIRRKENKREGRRKNLWSVKPQHRGQIGCKLAFSSLE
jgi:hypothetical protein